MVLSRNDVEALRGARAAVDALFSLVQPDSLRERPIPLRNRLVFYIGHVEAFDRNLLDTALPGLSRFAPDLDRLFAFGIDPPPGEPPSDTPEDWPESGHIADYCRRTRDLVDSVWEGVPARLRHVAIEHRLMHAETLAYMLQNMCPSRLLGSAEPPRHGPVPEWRMMTVAAGTTILGQNCDGEFGWDNEYAPHEVRVGSFDMSRHKVTNGDYLEFVNEGGTPSHFWVRRAGEWRLRRIFDEVPLPLNWPVYVTQRQAAAYADWRGLQLPSEAQWQRAAYPDGRAYPWGDDPPDRQVAWDPEPVDARPGQASPFGVEGLLGNGWEWTSSPFRPFDGFEPFPFYRGYSADFFDDEHFVLKGGSPRSDSVFLRRSFRNWFRSDYPYVFATFRCIRHTD